MGIIVGLVTLNLQEVDKLKKRLGGLVLVLLIVSLSISSVAFAEQDVNSNKKVITVPDDYERVQEAVDAAEKNYKIQLRNGYYSGFTIRGKSNLTITTVAGDSSVVIRGTVVFKNKRTQEKKKNGNKDIMLKGLTITGPGAGIQLRGTTKNLTVQGCSLINNEDSGIVSRARAEFSGLKIADSNISNNGQDGIALNGEGSHFTIEGNEIKSNGQNTATGVGVRLNQSVNDGLIQDNYIVDNPFAGIHPGG